MGPSADLLLVLVTLSDFMILGTSRLTTCIRAIALQGLLLGALPLALTQRWSLHIAALAIGSAIVKSLVLPWFLRRAIREAAVRREVEPRIGFSMSLVLVTQVVGYLMLENGIYLFGLTSAERVPFLVEVGVLLDVFVAVFIMGIVVFHINREFDSISSTRLAELRD